MNFKIVFLVFLIIQINIILSDKNVKQSDNDKFIPTKEWQVVKDGQSIPKGLHVRINLETGLKEAKLLEEHSKNERNSALMEVTEDNEKLDKTENVNSIEELNRILKNIDSDENLPPIPEEDVKRVMKDFKDYKQLKKELDDINVSVKSDVEILKDLINDYKEVLTNHEMNNEIKNNKIFSTLQYIEYLVHQIDNANDFIASGSFDEIIYKNLNNSDSKIKSEVLKILGSSASNNIKVQIYALESGAVEKITRLLALESNEEVKLRAIYALSSLLRRFPLAQNHFIKNGGLTVFGKIIAKPAVNIKLQLKIITLIYDLLIEQKEAVEDTSNVDFKERNKQYTSVNLENNLIKNGWCDIFNNILVNNLSIDDIDHDAVERCLNVLLLVTDNCALQFSNNKLMYKLNQLKNIYVQLEKEDNNASDSSYFSHLKDLTHNLITIIIHNYKSEL